MGVSFRMPLEDVKAALALGGYKIVSQNRNGNNFATVLYLSNGCIVNCWDNGKVNLQGKHTSEVEDVLCKPLTKQVANKKVNVVDGYEVVPGFNNCKMGRHSFVPIVSSVDGRGVYHVVRWCNVCGAIVVDAEYDGKLFQGQIKPLDSPALSLEIAKEN